MYETIIFIAVVGLTQFIKKYVHPKFGNTGVHVLTFVLALIGVGIYQATISYPNFGLIVTDALTYLVSTVAIYEIILKKVGFKSSKELF